MVWDTGEWHSLSAFATRDKGLWMHLPVLIWNNAELPTSMLRISKPIDANRKPFKT